MRYAVFADIHSNLEALNTVLSVYKKEGIDTYFCVGDIVGYGADPNACVEIIRATAKITVAGNHDWASVNLFSTDYFNPYAKEAVFWTKERLSDNNSSFLASLELVYQNSELTLVHGTLDNPEDFYYLTDGYAAEETFRRQETPVCFLGHTHVPGIFRRSFSGQMSYTEGGRVKIEENAKYIVNVGSIGQPRDGNPRASFCIYDSVKKEIEIKRIAYDVAAAREKILQAGLPHFFGERILRGQ